MNQQLTEDYKKIREQNIIGFYPQPRALFAVYGKEAVQFLNGLLTNDVAKLADGDVLRAAFPNAQGRLLATVRIRRQADKFLFETEEATREKIFNNLFRFTYAGDFFVEDLTADYEFLTLENAPADSVAGLAADKLIAFENSVFVPKETAAEFLENLKSQNAFEIDADLYEVLRIERGVPLYAIDMDETTIVPEVGTENLISYQKGCYIGQEIIARIHFRGHVAKQLRGLILEENVAPPQELKSLEDKNAGKITSVTFSPTLGKFIALAFVRYDFLAEGTQLKVNKSNATVKNLPFIG